MPRDNTVSPESTLALIGERIQKHREQRGLTREQLAEATGLSVQSIVKIESGTRNFRILTLISLAQVLGISTDYLLGLTDSDESQNILLLLSALAPNEKKFVADFIRLYSEKVNN